MRIDHCPTCKKAGLKYERYPHSYYSNPPLIPNTEQAEENAIHSKLNQKWCPRCKQWVIPLTGEWHHGTGTVLQEVLLDRQ